MNYHLVVGYGEIGKAIKEIFSPVIHHEDWGGNVFVHDPEKKYDAGLKGHPYTSLIMHICFPYSENFIVEVKKYQRRFKPKYTIIHSTVPVGTSRKCGAVFHPIIGQHPYLDKSILTFVQFFGGKNSDIVSEYFKRVGCRVRVYDTAESLELGKLSLTTQYALNIEYIKDFKYQCFKYSVNFTEAYTSLVEAYNEGYLKLGYPEYKLPILNPIIKKQGGHCTIPNCDLWETEFTEFIKKMNNLYE